MAVRMIGSLNTCITYASDNHVPHKERPQSKHPLFFWGAGGDWESEIGREINLTARVEGDLINAKLNSSRRLYSKARAQRSGGMDRGAEKRPIISNSKKGILYLDMFLRVPKRLLDKRYPRNYNYKLVLLKIHKRSSPFVEIILQLDRPRSLLLSFSFSFIVTFRGTPNVVSSVAIVFFHRYCNFSKTLILSMSTHVRTAALSGIRRVTRDT